jgi:hypothetical protein
VSLAETQAIFWRALQGEDAPRDIFVKPERVDIYVDMYVARLADALEQDFPETIALAGRQVALDYLKAHPSQDPDVGRIGRGFPEFVAPEFRALAAKEWARAEVFLEKDETPLTPEEFQQKIDPENFAQQRLHLIQALRIVGNTVVWRSSLTDVHELELPLNEARALRRSRIEEICAEGWIVNLTVDPKRKQD